jgi:prepilin-type N-terminal cleavage/methylation domain-containing protein
MKSPLPDAGPRHSGGFTIVELLVVVAIIAVLAGLSFIGGSTFLKNAASVRDMSNMRTLWASTIMYAADNNDNLPGPLTKGQKAVYGAKTTGRVNFFLASYMGYTSPQLNEFLPAMGSSWQKTPATQSAPCYLFRLDVPTGVGTETFSPWGNANPKPNLQPMKMSAALSKINASRTWAMTDVDQLHPDVKDAGWKADTPEKMAHGTYRLAVYFDGAGGKVDQENKPK